MKITCCPGCGSNFSTWGSPSKTTNKQPLVLKCGHTFCEACLILRTKRITTGHLHQNHLPCSTCKYVTIVENGVRDLPVNVYLSAYIEINQRGKLDQQLGAGLGQFVPAGKLMRSSSDVEIKCKMCMIKVATCKCVECDIMLCVPCFDKIHSMSAAIKHHKPSPLSLIVPQIPENQFEPKCAEHNRVLEYFCEDDSTSICSRCYIVGQHQNHSIISIEEKNKQVFEDIAIEVPKARIVLQHLARIDKKIVSAVPNVKAETKSLIENINQSFMTLHSLIQAREIEIINEVYYAYKSHLLSIDQKRDSFEKARIELEDTIKKSSKLLENNTLLLDGSALLASLRKSQISPCIAVKVDNSEETMHWQESNEDLKALINTYGSFLGVPPIRLEFKTFEEGQDQTEEEKGSGSVLSVGGALVLFQGNPSNARVEDNAENEDMIREPDLCKVKKDSTHETITLPTIKGPGQKVMVTHICSPNDFCVQIVCNKKQLETLTHNINTWCRRSMSVKQIPSSVDKDMMVLARYSTDKQWYRAKVLSVDKPTKDKDESSNIHVKYIDFGNEETIPIKEVRNMQKRFLKFPAFCVHCSLFDIAPLEEDQPWSVECVKEFHRMTQNQVLIMTALNLQGSVYEVDMSCVPLPDAMDDNYVSVRDILIFLDLARFRTFSDTSKNTSAPPSFTKTDYIKSVSVKAGEIVDVIVVQVTSPFIIHLACAGEEHDYYLAMHEEMQQIYNKDLCNVYSLFYPRPDIVCAAKGHDGQWHRAKVVSVPVHQQVTVILVDLGITQTVHYNCLKKLLTSFIKLPVQAIACRLADVCPRAGPASEWSDEAEQWCANNLTNASAMAKFFIRCGQETEIVLWLDNVANSALTQSINSALVDQGFAQSTGPSSIKRAGESSISLSSFTGKGHHNARRDDVRDQSDVSPKVLKLRKTSVSPTGQKKSSPLSSSPHKATKLNESPSKSNKIESLKKTSPKAKKCSRTPNSNEEKQRIQQEIHKAMNIDGSTVTDTIYIEVIVCSYVSPSEFYVQIQETRDDLTKLMKDMQATFAESKPVSAKSWSVNEYCASKFCSDGLWCRASVLRKVSADQYEVEYVDFGNAELVNASDLRPLPSDFSSRIPCAAARCHLANLMPAGTVNAANWSHTAAEFVASLLKDRKLYIKQEGEPTELGLPVDLIMEDEIPETAFEPKIQCYRSVRKEVLKMGLAMPIKKPSFLPSLNTSGNEPVYRSCHKIGDSASIHGHSAQSDAIDFNKNSLPQASPDNVQSAAELVETEAECLDDVRIVPQQPESLPPYPIPQPGVTISAVPTYVDVEGVIYVQPVAWEGKCMHLSEELQRVCGQVLPVGHRIWQVGQMCAALFPDDGLWYRAVIQELKGKKFKVHYIDFGNCAWVKFKNLREMLPEFVQEHVLAYRCVLHDLEVISSKKVWPEETWDYVQKQVVNQSCTIVPMQSDTTMTIEVQLFIGDTNLAEDLISKNMAFSCLGITNLCEQSCLIGHVLANQNPYHALEVGDVGDTFKAFMVHAELPDIIYLQRGLGIEPEGLDFVKASEVAEINNCISEFVNMADKLKCCKLLPVTHLPDVGLMCAALFSADDQLYRALCVKQFPEAESCLVLFVDYGTSEVVPKHRLKLLPSEFWGVPAQAIRCNISLSFLSESARKLDHHLFACIIKCVMEQELMVRLISKSPLSVELMVKEDGEWIIPYTRLFEDNTERASDLEVMVNDKNGEAVDNIITLHDVKEATVCKENWNDDSDDDTVTDVKKKVAVEAVKRTTSEAASSRKKVSSVRRCSRSEKSQKELQSVGKTQHCKSEGKPSQAKCKVDNTKPESGEHSRTVKGETTV